MDDLKNTKIMENFIKKEINDENVGTILVDYNPVFETFKVYKNGVAFKKISKKEFALSSDYEEITVRFDGNLFKGIVVSVGKNNYQLLDPAPWYMYIFGLIPILMNIILGNNH